MSKIQKELEGVADISQSKGEDYKDYLVVLVEAIAGGSEGTPPGVDDDIWYKLSTPAREWVEAGIKSLNEKQDILDFPDKVVTESPEPRVRRGRNKDIVNVEPIVIEDVNEGKEYGISFKDDEDTVAPIKSYRGIVQEVTRRSVIIIDFEKGEQIIHKKDITCILSGGNVIKDVNEKAIINEHIVDEKAKSIFVKDAIKGERYLIVGGSDNNTMVEVDCIRVTSSKGIFDADNDDRYKLELDIEIECISDDISNVESCKEPNELKEEKEIVTKQPKIKKSKKSKKEIAIETVISIIIEEPTLTEEHVNEKLVSKSLSCAAYVLHDVYKYTHIILSIIKR